MRILAGATLALLLIAGGVEAQVIDPGNRPPVGGGVGPMIRLAEPDGTIFVATPDGGALHQFSGFDCPAQLEGYTRDRLTVFDRSEGGRDVACGYRDATGKSWFTLYITRLPGLSGDDVFRTYVRQAQEVSPVAAEVEAPLTPGLPPLPGFSRFWENPRGAVDGLWMSQLGPWHIKLRVTYDKGEEPKVTAFAEALYRRINDQVAVPEV